MQNYLIVDYPKVAAWIVDNYNQPASDKLICQILNDLDADELHVHDGKTLTAVAADYAPIKDKTFWIKSEERFWKELTEKIIAGPDEDDSNH